MESIDRVLLFPGETFILLTAKCRRRLKPRRHLMHYNRLPNDFQCKLNMFIKRQTVGVYPVQGVFLAETRGKDDHPSAVDATK